MALKRRTLIWLVMLAVIISVIALYRSMTNGIEVKAYQIRKKDLVISVTGTSTGTIKADREVKLTAQRTGSIAKLYVEEGAVVAAGSSLSDLESDEMQQRLQLASASLQRMQAQSEGLRLGLISFRADIDAGISKSRAVLDEAEARIRRYRELRDKGYISESDLDSVRREYDVAKASYSASLAAREQIRAREEDLRAQSAAIEQAKREYNLAKIMLDYSFIRSPIAGVVTSRPVKIGETVPVGGLIASVVSLDSLYIEALVDEADAAKVVTGQRVSITMDAYPDRTMNGEVYMISPVVLGNKQEARTFEVRVRLLDRDVKIKPGMSADVEVIVNKKENVLTVPSQAIMERSDGKFIYVVQSSRAVQRPIKTGQFNWTYTEVTEGLQEGDMVITNPDISGLKEKARVRAVISDK